MRGLFTALVVGAFNLALAERAFAEDDDLLLLNYRAPVDCPHASDFRKEVTTILESPERAPRRVPVDVVIALRVPTGYALTLQLPNGKRKLEGNECSDVVRGAALFVALLLEDPALQERTTPKPAPPPAAPPEAPPPPAPRSTGLYLGVEGGVDTGTSPRVGAMSVLRAGLRFRGVSLEVLGLVGFPQRATFDSGLSLRTAWTAGGLRICPQLVSSKFVLLDVCGGLSGGVLLVRSPELAAPQAAAPGFLGVDSSAGLWFLASPRLAFAVTAEFSSPLVRPLITVDGPGDPTEAHRLDHSFRATLGPRVFF